MLNSMTGFARLDAESSSGTMTCEIRTVNHRYLDIQVRLPDDLRAREIELKQLVSAAVQRGKVECSIYLRRAEGEQGQLNIELVRQIGARIGQLQKMLPDVADVNPLDILRWPGVLQEAALETEPMFEAAADLLQKTLASLVDMRAREGERIEAMLTTRCDEILVIAEQVKIRMPEVLAAVRARQLERIEKLDVAADPARLETELALIAQKLDVDEELDRLQSHISEIRGVLANAEAVGRRLDFLMQELNREANTLGSKSADAETTKAAVDLKVLIEQMREQIQNIE